jgi:hypothetical protein
MSCRSKRADLIRDTERPVCLSVERAGGGHQNRPVEASEGGAQLKRRKQWSKEPLTRALFGG